MKKVNYKLTTFARTCRKIIFGFFLLLILSGLLWFLYLYSGRMLCKIALRQIAELTATDIKTESVVFNPRGAVTIENLIINPRDIRGDDISILNAGKVYAQFSVRSLFSLKPRLQIIDVNDFVLNLRYETDTGKSNLDSLKIQSAGGGFGALPQVHLQNGILKYTRISGGKEIVAASIPIDADFGPDVNSLQSYAFEVKTSTLSSGFGTSRLTGSFRPGIFIITGGISTQDIPELEMACSINVLAGELKYDENSDFSLKLRLKDLLSKRSESLDKLAAFGPAFLIKSPLFGSLQDFCDRYQPKGLIDIELNATGNLKRPSESSLEGEVICKDASFRNADMPYAIDNLTGRIDFNQQGVTLNSLRGKHGDTELVLDGWSRNFGKDWQYKINITSDNMPLDRDMYNAMSSGEKKVWAYFEPSGYAGLNIELSRLPETDGKTVLSLLLKNVDAVYRYFPYPLKNLTGAVSIGRDGIDFSNVVSRQDERIITLNGRLLTTASNAPGYDISIDVNNIPLDSTLQNLLPEKQRMLYEQINPSGLADGKIIVRSKDAAGSADFTADLTFRDATLHLSRLSLPLTDVSARAVIEPDSIVVKNLSCLYDDSPVLMEGKFLPGDGRQILYDISVSGRQMRLSDDLLNFAPKSPAESIRQLKPDGRVNISADITRMNLAEAPDYKIKITCIDNSINIPRFPYTLKNIKGSLSIDANSVDFENVTASIGGISPADINSGTVSITGKMNLSNNAFDEATLSLSAKDIPSSRQFADILPEHIRSLYEKLSPAGAFDLDFNNISLRTDAAGLRSLDFDGQVRLKNCSLNIIDANSELNAVVKTRGLYQAESGFSSIAASIENGAIKILGKSFTGIRADIHIDPNLKSLATEGLIADCSGGKVTGKFELVQPADDPMEYTLQVAYNNVDINDFLASGSGLLRRDENAKRRQNADVYTSGKMKGFFSVTGQPADSNSLIGTCNFTITAMKVGKMSLLGRLVNIINLSEQGDYIYDSMFVDSYIKGNKLVVRKIDLSGRSTAYTGSGLMDIISHNIDLNLTARGRRSVTAEPSALQSLTEGLGQAVIRVDITGKFDNPIVTTRALPVIKETLNILGTKPQMQN